MNEDAPSRGLFKFWAHMFDYRDEHKYGSHSLKRRSGTDHLNLVYWYSIASGPSLNHPNPQLILRRHYKLQDNEALSLFHYLPALSTTAQYPTKCSPWGGGGDGAGARRGGGDGAGVWVEVEVKHGAEMGGELEHGAEVGAKLEPTEEGGGAGAWGGGGDGAGAWGGGRAELEPRAKVGGQLEPEDEMGAEPEHGAEVWGGSWSLGWSRGRSWSVGQSTMMVYILRRANFPTFGAMNEDAPIRGLFKFWAHMFDYRDEHKYGSHSLRRRSGTDHPNLVYWYSIALGPSLKHPNPRLTLRRHYKAWGGGGDGIRAWRGGGDGAGVWAEVEVKHGAEVGGELENGAEVMRSWSMGPRAYGGGGGGAGAWGGGGDEAGAWGGGKVEVGRSWSQGPRYVPPFLDLVLPDLILSPIVIPQPIPVCTRLCSSTMMVYILRRANFPTFGAMNEDAPGRGLFKFWAHMFDYRDGHIYGSHSLRRRSGTEHPNLVYWYSVASEPSLNHPNPRLTLRRRYKLQDNETLSVFHYLPALSTTAQDPIECSHPFLIFD
ncbi:hypothetical protein HID58_075581 [Brassica napus]|uniref:Uncharacterized protein n=1 Tax=Brassica napus TaxID=3708 RepID=A0ABQ7YL84_BRANA|nr:hypothetical protein HID58_075581 [Brassica napus]